VVLDMSESSDSMRLNEVEKVSPMLRYDDCTVEANCRRDAS
jgi:hypothetical protein